MAAYFDENKKNWYCKFSYKDWTGKTKYTTKTGFRTKKEAQAYEKDFKSQSTETPTLSLNALSEAFLKDYAVDRRPASLKMARNNLRLHILPYIGEMNVADISPLVIRNWQAEINNLGKSPSTVHAINTTFKTVLNFAVKYYNLPSNPFSKTGTQGSIQTRKDFIEADDWEKIDDLIENKFDKAFFNLMYYSGLRIGEALALTLNDIDFKSGVISVTKQYNDITGQIVPPKTKTSVRKVTLPSHCVAVIKAYIDSLVAPEKYPFQLISQRSLNSRLKKYCRKAGVTEISLHLLRHSHASYLIKLGTIPVNAIAQRLGHSPAMTLKIYAHVYKDQDAEIASILEKPKKKILKLA